MAGAPTGSPPAPQAATPGALRQHVLQLAENHGFQWLRDGFDDEPSVILRGSNSQWESAPFPPSAVCQLSLEDIFIALASEVTADL